MAEWQSLLNLSDKCLGVYCTVCMSQDLMRMQKPLKYLKQRDLRQGISHTGDGRLRSPAENPEIRASHCQPPAGGTTQEGAVPGAQALGLLSKLETTSGLGGGGWRGRSAGVTMEPQLLW